MENVLYGLMMMTKFILGFIVFVVALSITVVSFSYWWFYGRYINELKFKIALEECRSKRSEERWQKREKEEED